MTVGTQGERHAIAVIGMACRVPGARGVEEFWQLLLDGVHAVTDAPVGRPPGRGGYLDGVDGFDADFFRVPPLVAEAMDPQQRLLLECAWEALEDAGLRGQDVAGSRTGVFVGTDGSPYWDAQPEPTIYGVLGGGARSAMAGRVSFAFDLTGPSLVVDTACSSSLVAVALACQSLRAGESTSAIAAGVHLGLGAREGTAFAAAGMLAADGRCKFGDASADGFVRSEGVAAVVLKPLSAALVDGDPVHAVIRGVGTGNDGNGSGLFMAPAVSGQVDMLRAAYADAGLDPAAVSFVEAHGTGTQAGDPVELAALADVLGAGRDRPLLVGSLKTNIGHTEAAAGIIGLVKAVLCLRHRTVPGNLHLSTRNPEIPWADLPLVLPTSAQPLDADELVVGVSAFGVSGTNAHVVLTPAVPSRVRHADAALAETGPEQVLPLSARSPEALRDLIRFHLAHLGRRGAGRASEVRDLCYTAATRRTHHNHRVAVVGSTHDELAERLRAVLHGDGRAVAHDRAKVVFVFPGQGSQWLGMGRELLEVSPAFRHALHRCDAAVRVETGWSVVERLLGDEPLSGIDVVQPVLWAVEVALAETWRAWGVEPDAVIGHSMGEVAAAAVSGALALADAAAVICRRSALMRPLAGKGAMAVVGLDRADAEELVVAGRVSVAVVNGPGSTVLSGDPAVIEQIMSTVDEQGAFCRRVDVDVASHSPQMDVVLPDLVGALAGIEPAEGRVPLHSTVTGLPGERLDAAYWARNLREPVRFAEVVGRVADGPTVFVEISPHPLLLTTIREATGCEAVGSLRRDEPERASMLASLAALYERHAPIRWDGLYGGGRCVPLPHYPWQRERFWHPTDNPDTDVTRLVLDTATSPYLLEHVVNGVHLVPGTVLLDAARAAGERVTGGPVELSDVDFRAAIVLAPGERKDVEMRLAPSGPDRWRFTARCDDAEHCVGSVIAAGVAREPRLADIRGRMSDYLSGEAFYLLAAQGGTRWGPALRGVTDLWRGDGEALARVVPPPQLPDATIAHPAVLEACAAPLVGLLGGPGWVIAEHVDRVALADAPGLGWAHVRVTSSQHPTVTADITVFDEQERVVAELDGVRVRSTLVPPEQGGLTVELSGELRIRDASRTILELRGSLALHPVAHHAPVAAQPIQVSAPPVAVPAPAIPDAPAVDADAVLERLISRIADVTRKPAARIDARKTAGDLGVDSLMSLEVKSRLQQELGVSVPAKLLLGAGSLRAAAEQIAALARR